MKTTTKQKLAFTILFLCTVIVVLPVLFVLAVVIKNSWGAVTWEFLTSMPKNNMKAGGIYPAVVGTIYLVSLSTLFSLPIGLFAAIYLNEYAKENMLTRLIRLAIVNLAGVSSVVYGLFGLAMFVTFLKFGVSILSGALTLAIMNLPVIITASVEALASVPYSFREVSLSLGASRWQTIRHSVLPFAIPGILTGAILSLARAAGETAPILFTVAAFYLPNLPHSIFDQAMALPYHLYIISTQIPGISQEMRYGTALVLVGIVFSMNIFAVIIRSKFRKKKKW